MEANFNPNSMAKNALTSLRSGYWALEQLRQICDEVKANKREKAFITLLLRDNLKWKSPAFYQNMSLFVEILIIAFRQSNTRVAERLDVVAAVNSVWMNEFCVSIPRSKNQCLQEQ
jgi:hypothetical protein